jgi:hypothetical protein
MPLSTENAVLSHALATELEGYVQQLQSLINNASEDLFSLCATIFAIASFINLLAKNAEGTLFRRDRLYSVQINENSPYASLNEWKLIPAI